MRTYWYYTYKCSSSFGSGVSYSFSEDFGIVEVYEYLRKNLSKNVVVTNWKQISKSQYEKMEEYFDNQQ